MLIKIGDRIVNTDRIQTAQYQPANSAQNQSEDKLVLYFKDAAANTSDQNRFTGEDAKTLWAALTAQAEKDSER
jgi:hypothetical protein